MQIKTHIPTTFETQDGAIVLGIKRLNYQEACALRIQYRDAQQTKPEADDADEKWGALINECLTKYVKLKSELTVEIDEEDGTVTKRKLRRAIELLEFFGGSPGFLYAIIESVVGQNTLSVEKKRFLQLHIASELSLDEPPSEVRGPKPETTAGSAEPPDSASSAVATESENNPFGSTDQEPPQSSSTNAPFTH